MTDNNFYSKTIVVWIGAFICCFLWGSAFPCIKIGYKLFNITAGDSATQILFAGIRFFLAGILAVAMGSVAQRRLLIPQKKSVSLIFKLSSFQTIGQYIFFYIGLAHTSGVRASIVEGTNVFVAIFVAAIIFHQEALTLKKVIGSIIGFTGVILVNIMGAALGSGNFLSGDMLIFLSTICYAFSSVFLKRYSKYEDTVLLSGYQFLVGGFVMMVVGYILGGRISVLTIDGMGMLIYLAFISSAAYSLWGILLKHNPVSRVAVFGFMNPMIGVILSAILLNEGSALNIWSLVSLILICIGIYIVNVQGKDNQI